MAEVEDDVLMTRFIRDYLALLDGRVDAILEHLQIGDDGSAHVALLSLESTSVMVGADDLVTAVHRLRKALEAGDRGAFTRLGLTMAGEAERVHGLFSDGVRPLPQA